MNSDPAKCPICGGDNDCQLACADGYKGPCWCEKKTFTPELLARVAEDVRRRNCVCRHCVNDERKKSDLKACPGEIPGAE
jgi:hypothetical protein